MLQSIRNFTKGKLSKVLLVILIIPFVLWGMGDVFRGGSQTTIATLNDKRISIINKLNEGHGKTLIRGYDLALKTNCDFILQIDSDDQIPINELPKILENSKDHDLITGYRYKRNDPLIRILITNIIQY